MATDDERRRVAARLRAARGPSLMVLMDVLGVGGAHLFARLADLIEPDTTGDTTKTASDTTKCDREALLALADDLETYRLPISGMAVAEHIREACGEAS